MINGLVEIPGICAKFVGSKNADGFQAVINDFKKAKEIRILTYSNITDRKLKILKDLNSNQKVTIIVPLAGMRESSLVPNTYKKSEVEDKLKKMQSLFKLEEYHSNNITIKVCFANHAKIVGTENVLYVGSANYSNYSHYSYEAGMLIEDTEAIKNIYDKFFDNLCTVVIRNSEFDAAKVFFLNAMEEILDAYHIMNSADLIVNEAAIFYKKLNSAFDNVINITQMTLDEEDTYKLCCNNFDNFIKRAQDMIDSLENGRDRIPDWNMSLEDLADYFELEHQYRKGVNSEDAWISEDEKYCPLRDEWDKEEIIAEYIVENWEKDENVKMITDSIDTCIDAMEDVLNDMNVFQENEVIRQATDSSIPK